MQLEDSERRRMVFDLVGNEWSTLREEVVRCKARMQRTEVVLVDMCEEES